MDGARILQAARRAALGLGALISLAAGLPALAQVQTVDPDKAIDADLAKVPSAVATPAPTVSALPTTVATPAPQTAAAQQDPTASPGFAQQATAAPGQTTPGQTFHKDDLIGAAEGVFGKGAHGLAAMIEDILSKQGEPNAYIAGREGGGAMVVGLRYGSGTLYHKVEGQMPVYWTGPSIGFDAGANAGNTFVLVYNLYDTSDLYHRYGSGEGQAYLIGGFNVSYMRRKDVVLIPVRMGVGLRLGVNAGYMKMSRRQNWFPF